MTDQTDALRLALSPLEAAAAIGVSRSTFYASVIGELRVVRLGTRVLIPTTELESWLKRHAQHTQEVR